MKLIPENTFFGNLTVPVSLPAMLILLPLVAGCATTLMEKNRDMDCPPAPDINDQTEELKQIISNLEKQLQTTKNRYRARKHELLELRLKLAERESRNRQLQQSLEQAIQDVANTKARLRNHFSRAGTVTDLAELRVELESAENRSLDIRQQQWLIRAKHYRDMAEEALAADNHEGARYLTNRARQALGQLKSIQPDNGDSHAAFPVPVTMETRLAGNVREFPGLGARVLFTLPAHARVSAIDRQGLWVKVVAANGNSGWIHFSILRILSFPDTDASRPEETRTAS